MLYVDLLFASFMKVIGKSSIQFKNSADGRLFHSVLKKAYTYEAMSLYQQTIDTVGIKKEKVFVVLNH